MEQRRIPTLVGLLLIAVGLTVSVFGVQQFTRFRSQAEASAHPQDVKITNISDKSFTVTWLTELPTIGFISHGPTSDLGINADDDRQDSEKYTTHHVTVSGLESTTKYYFKIGSGAKLYDSNGAPYEVTTASSNDSSKRDIISGFVMKEKNEPASDALVVVTIKDSSPLSTLTNSDGQYRIDLAQARDKTNFNQISYNATTDFVDIGIKLPPDGEAAATTTTTNSHPVPPITLGALNDFTQVSPPTQSSRTQITITSTPQNSSSNQSGGSFQRSRDALGVTGNSPPNNASQVTNSPSSLINQKSLDELGL